MSEVKPDIRQAADRAEITAALLALGSSLERFSLMLTATALLALVLSPSAIGLRLSLLGIVVAGLAAQFFALRTAFDQPLFAAWSRRWRRAGANKGADLAAFDTALAAVRLRPAREGPPRTLSDRIAGARRLFWQQGVSCVLQIVGWLIVILLVIFTP